MISHPPAIDAYVVTGADEAYAELILGCVESLAAARDKVRFRIGVLDFGLAPETRQKLERLADAIVAPHWPFSARPEFQEKAFSLASVSRLFLPDHFPGANVYVWLDADAFVLDGSALVWLAQAAHHAGLAVVPTVDRSYRHTETQQKWVEARYAMAFGQDTAVRMMRHAYINTGVWSAAAGAPVWTHWRNEFQMALERWNGPRPSDQAILNYVLQTQNIPHHRLPSSCNWIAHLAKPFIDTNRRMLTEPSFPFAPVRILHNTYTDKMKPRPFRTLDGRETMFSLTYHGVLGAISNLVAAPQPVSH